MSKRELRCKLRELRGSQQERYAQSEAISRHILDSDAFQRADVIAGYAALPHEADINKVLNTALLLGKTVVMPRCGAAPEMTLHQIASLEELRA
jgi:5-formyltetrahydrofolate cyclo-ligase